MWLYRECVWGLEMMNSACNEQKKEKIPGIIGGMGPEATVDLMQRIIANTVALDDIDHIRCIIDNNPKVPSRIKAILESSGVNPGPCLAVMAKRLEQWGADFLVMPCNTAHYYYDYIADAVSIPVVHLIDLVVEKVIAEFGNLREIGMLGSTTIIKTALYQKRFEAHGMRTVYPDEDMQESLFRVVRQVKAGRRDGQVARDFVEICSQLGAKGIEVCILGCTELGVIRAELPIKSIDAAEVLAQEVVAVVKEGKAPCVAKY
jgi:aspartate racemase